MLAHQERRLLQDHRHRDRHWYTQTADWGIL